MLTRYFSRVAAAVLAVLLIQTISATDARAQAAAALAGQVTSAEEGPMEGVVVSAKKQGSTITVSVITDEQGRYSFPANRLEPGEYALSTRAVGYDLDGPRKTEIAARTGHDRRSQASQDPQSHPAAHQCRVDDERHRHGRPEARAHQLRELPHARAGHEVDLRRRRARRRDRADEQLCAGEHGAAAAAAHRHDARLESGTLPQGGRIYRHHQSQPVAQLEL